MTNETRAEIEQQATELARLARAIETAGKLAPRHRLDATVEATMRYNEALDRLRYFLYQRTNFSLSTSEISA